MLKLRSACGDQGRARRTHCVGITQRLWRPRGARTTRNVLKLSSGFGDRGGQNKQKYVEVRQRLWRPGGSENREVSRLRSACGGHRERKTRNVWAPRKGCGDPGERKKERCRNCANGGIKQKCADTLPGKKNTREKRHNVCCNYAAAVATKGSENKKCAETTQRLRRPRATENIQ